jgi:hypothetical protein
VLKEVEDLALARHRLATTRDEGTGMSPPGSPARHQVIIPRPLTPWTNLPMAPPPPRTTAQTHELSIGTDTDGLDEDEDDDDDDAKPPGTGTGSGSRAFHSPKQHVSPLRYRKQVTGRPR